MYGADSLGEKEFIEALHKKITLEINDLLGFRGLRVYEASLHLIKAGGKLLRPTLVLLGLKTVGGEIEQALPTATGIELAHIASLMHDDIIDNVKKRRGVDAVHVKYGEPTAIVAGDLLLVKLFQAISKNSKVEGVTQGQIVKALEVASEACISVCEGQGMDLDFMERWDVTEEECLEMYKKKTAAAFSGSLAIGAILGGGNEKEIRALSEFGTLLGIAFQIQDDHLGYFGAEEKLGKPLTSDLRNGKNTLLIVHALQNLKGYEREILMSTLGNNDASEEQIAEVIKILKNSESIEYVRKKTLSLIQEAKSKLAALRDTDAKRILLGIAEFALQRER